MKNKKAQLSLGDAPSVVLIVGLTFLIMATLAYIGVKYGDATATETAGTTLNETITGLAVAGDNLASAALRNSVCSITAVNNATSGQSLSSTNYTVSTDGCTIYGTATSVYLGKDVNVSYTYVYDKPSVATNVTDDLNTEIENNTSIAGIVLTISLVGIVLTVLIGIFVIAKNRGM